MYISNHKLYYKKKIFLNYMNKLHIYYIIKNISLVFLVILKYLFFDILIKSFQF